MGKNIFNTAYQNISFIPETLLFATSILLLAVGWIGCDGGNGKLPIEVVGDEEVVFDWSTEHCDDGPIAIYPARAFRDDTDQVQMISSDAFPRRFIGPDLNSVRVQCRIIFESDYDPDPSTFNNEEYIRSTYTEDGRNIFALVTNEYKPGGDNWYNSVTLAVSTDGGFSYNHPITPPGHLVAASTYKYIPDTGYYYGAWRPTNIVRGKDGFFYTIIVFSQPYHDSDRLCLMRTDDFSDPKSWRFWDGVGFEGKFINPYEETSDPNTQECEPLRDLWGNKLPVLSDSLTFNTYLHKYVLIGVGGDGAGAGFLYALSSDLIHWKPFVLFYHRVLPWTADNPSEVVYNSPSLLDPNSTSMNFDTTGKTAYLYYTRFNGGPDADIVRVPVEFFRE